jgi:hypothetical protein
VNPYNHNHTRNNKRHKDDDNDDIQILEDYCTVRTKIIFYSIIYMNRLGSKCSSFSEQ